MSGLYAAATGVLRRSDDGRWTALPHTSHRRWNAVSVVGPDDVWAVGTGGAVGRWDGTTFTELLLPGARYDLLDVVAREGEAWISAAGHELWHAIDGKVTSLTIPALADKRSGALFWPRPDRLFVQAHPMAARLGSHVLVGDRSGFEDQPVQTRGYGFLARLHGTGPADVWGAGMRGKLFGKAGALFRFDGSAWRELALPVDRPLHAVWARSRSEAWIGGEQGTLLRFDGTSLVPVDLGTKAAITALCAPPDGPVLAVLDTRDIVRIEP